MTKGKTSDKRAKPQPMLTNVTPSKNNVQPVQKDVDQDARPLSVFIQPGLQMQNAGRPSPPMSVVSTTNTPDKKMPAKKSSLQPAVAAASPQQPAPATMEEAMNNFKSAKQQAQKDQKYLLNSNQRLIDAMADVVVLLLTKAMSEGMTDHVEIRIYKKGTPLDGALAVAEYRDARKKDAVESMVFSNELTQRAINQKTPQGMKALDCAQNWAEFYTVIQKWGLWWRFCMAVHKRIGWKCSLERSMLNGLDSKFLGFVSFKIGNFI